MERYEVIIPERIYIVQTLKEAGDILRKYPGRGGSIRLKKDGEI